MAVDSAALTDALGEHLANDAGVTTALGSHAGRIRSAHRADGVLPYVSIGEDDIVNLGDNGPTLAKVDTRLHIWTREAGQAQNKAIAVAIIAALDNQRFEVPGHRMVLCRVIRQRTMDDPEDGIVHGVLDAAVHIETA